MKLSDFRGGEMNRWIHFGMAFLTLTVGAGIVANYDCYFPPDFDSDFLYGRGEYFWGWYSTAFYAHIVFSPLALFTGLFGFSNRLLRKAPGIHRLFGRIYIYSTLLVVVPSGMVIAVKSFAGTGPAISFFILGIVTWIATLMGLVQAIRRNFKSHQTWMTRSFLLMFSAVVLRMNEQFLQGFDPELAYQFNSWASWLPIIVFFEVLRTGDKKNLSDVAATQQIQARSASE